MLVEDMSRNKCFFFSFEYHMLYVLYPPVTYLLTAPCNKYSSRLNGLLHDHTGSRDDGNNDMHGLSR
jgi:hypothetical protein